ncbi:hypothetical protein GCM10007140_38860 [Priestia taiwanensis]|uniref:Uncharacterized protein n=1 Tax=Priestia taiwanensis TaxID=1347902 RepID=A0A917AXZ1_9BACI|nr:hypothetical protein GCM10007140_38860 [Priestia taiwanensis]
MSSSIGDTINSIGTLVTVVSDVTANAALLGAEMTIAVQSSTIGNWASLVAVLVIGIL